MHFKDKAAIVHGLALIGQHGREAVERWAVIENAGYACKLIDQGYATDENQNGTYITDEGRKLLATARAMGW